MNIPESVQTWYLGFRRFSNLSVYHCKDGYFLLSGTIRIAFLGKKKRVASKTLASMAC